MIATLIMILFGVVHSNDIILHIYIYTHINTYIGLHSSWLLFTTLKGFPTTQHVFFRVPQDVLKAIVEYLSIDGVFLDKSACWIFAPRLTRLHG